MAETSGSFALPSIVVGVDGSRAADIAARWALDEAVGRGLPLRLVSAAEGDADTGRARSLLDTTAAAVRAAGRGVTIETAVVAGEPVAALLGAARSAVMLCVGAVGLKHFEHRSTLSALVASVHCPVAVVRGERHRGWVVVELDETPDSAAVLQAAVEEARLRSAPLRVLGTWQSPGAGGYDAEQRNRLVRSQLDRRLENWRHRYPDLDVEPVAVPGSGMEWMSAQSAHIGLVVIGARNIVAVTELLGPAGPAALPGASVLIVDRQRLL